MDASNWNRFRSNARDDLLWPRRDTVNAAVEAARGERRARRVTCALSTHRQNRNNI